MRHWNQKLCKKSYNLDSERYTAKACAYLCRLCLFIDGFCEFSESMHSEMGPVRQNPIQGTVRTAHL